MANICSVQGVRRLLSTFLVASLCACASGPEQLKPADLGPNPALMGVRSAWSSKIAPVDFPLQAKVTGNSVALAAGDGAVLSLDARSGAVLW
ncbi:MAG: hypothetical protein RLZZ371_2099, partial [Pseudomonadota bacterium]